ncbi:MAG: insulinase family protein [Clostridiales bacterium]|nr:insulinase family protein [Candidatus Apopatousia equi]
MAEKYIYKYPNGATLIYYQTNAAEKTDATLGFKCGSKYEGVNKGITHLLEHMFFTGTKSLSKEDIGKFFTLNAAEFNGATTQHSVNINFLCPASKTESIFRLSADMLLSTDFTQKELDRERKIVKQELYMHGEQKTIKEKRKEKVIIDNPVVGNDETLDNITIEDLKDYSEKYFITDNLVMSVVSSLPYEQIKEYCEKFVISRLKSNKENKASHKKIQYDYLTKDMEVYVDEDKKNTIMVQIIFNAHKNDEMFELYSHFENFYFNSGIGTGLIKNKMRFENPLAYASGLGFDIVYDNNLKFLYTETSPENVDTVIDKMLEVINHVAYTGITDKDLAMYKVYLANEHEMRPKTKDRDSGELFQSYVEGYQIFTPNFYKKLMSLTKKELNQYFFDTFAKSKIILSLSGNLAKYENMPAQEQFDEIVNKFQFAPLTISDEKNEEIYLNDYDKLMKQYHPLPTAEEIARKYRLDAKVFYDIENSFLPPFTKENARLLNMILNHENIYKKLGKTFTIREMKKILREQGVIPPAKQKKSKKTVEVEEATEKTA